MSSYKIKYNKLPSRDRRRVDRINSRISDYNGTSFKSASVERRTRWLMEDLIRERERILNSVD